VETTTKREYSDFNDNSILLLGAVSIYCEHDAYWDPENDYATTLWPNTNGDNSPGEENPVQ
jgi:hypothetical protein